MRLARIFLAGFLLMFLLAPLFAAEVQNPDPSEPIRSIAPESAPGQPETPDTLAQPQGEQPPAINDHEFLPPPDMPPSGMPLMPAAEPQPGPPVPAMPAPVRSGDVTFNFDDADVFSVIQTIFGDILRVNYIIDPQVKGRVNFRAVVPIKRADVLPLMEVILRLNGIGIIEEAGLYRIVPLGSLSREPAAVGMGREAAKIVVTGKALMQVVPIRNVQSAEMVRILTPFVSQNALIVDVPKSNYIIIVDTDSNVRRLLSLVEMFDGEHLKQARPQVHVYPIQNSKAKDVAAILNQIFFGGTRQTAATAPAAGRAAGQAQQQPPAAALQAAIGGGSGDIFVSEVTRIFPDEIANTIIILATPEDYQLIADTIAKVDTMPRQVMIEGLIAQVTLTDNLSFGMSWSLKTDVNFSLKPFTRDFSLSGQAGQNAPGAGASALSSDGFSFVATDPSGIVRARIEALAVDSRAKVLAAPHILVSDNREARIQVGQQVPLVTSETNVTGTTNIQRTIQYKDIGIILKVKPQVNDSGLVSLEITQEVSSLGSAISLSADTRQPTLNKTEATTTLVAKDGQTIVIGGLIRDDTTKGRTGLPFLSKLPLLGWLFGRTNDDDTRTELLILLTPRVVRNQDEAASMSSDFLKRGKDVGKELKRGQKFPAE